MLQPGEQIDIWVVEKSLGAGGMGSVYKCHNRDAQRIKAAVKVLEGSVLRMPGATERFIREAEILFSLEHRNIVKVRNVRTDHSPPYLEMEFVEGEALEDKLARGTMPLGEALDMMGQMADAIAYLHGRGIRHRDIKPANVLVRRDGTLKVVDFGLAMEADTSRITQAGMTFGTVSYAPPEWIHPDNLDPESWDIYAAGVCFYEMLSGKVAFPVSGQGSARQQAMQVILSKQNHPPLDVGAGFAEPVRALVREMTHPDKAARPQSMAEIAKRIHALDGASARGTGQTLLPPKEGASAPPAPAPKRADPTTWMEEEAAPGRIAHLPTVQRSDPPRRARRGLLAGAAAGAAALTGIGVLVCAGVLALYPPGGAPTGRDVEVVVSGLAEGTPIDVRLGGVAPSSREGWAFRFPAAPLGDATLGWAVGEGCAAADCPGASCPAWCAGGRATHAVEVGAEALVLPLTPEPPPTRTVRLHAPGVGDDWQVSYTVAGAQGRAIDPRTTELDLAPGRYALLAEAGTCPPEARACQATSSCPPGCSSWEGEIVVPWGTGSHGIDVASTSPAPPPKGAAVVAAKDPSPKGDPPPKDDPPAAAGSAGRVVTYGDFAAWLEKNADWKRETAIADDRADPNYLSDWTDGAAPSGAASRPVVNVSWYAASAFCRSRGGLASIDAEPLKWTGEPYLEWRVEGTKPAWRSGDGEDSTQVRMKDSNGMAGFRCAK